MARRSRDAASGRRARRCVHGPWRDEHGAVPFKSGFRNAVNKNVSLEQCRPYGRKRPFRTNSVHTAARSCDRSLDTWEALLLSANLFCFFGFDSPLECVLTSVRTAHARSRLKAQPPWSGGLPTPGSPSASDARSAAIIASFLSSRAAMAARRRWAFIGLVYHGAAAAGP